MVRCRSRCTSRLLGARGVNASGSPHYRKELVDDVQKMLRGDHKCPPGTFLRLTSANEVYRDDPRVEIVGELNTASKKLFHGVMLKVQDILSTDPKDRRDVDVSEYPWLAHLDRFSPERRQEYADRNTASEQTVSQPPTKKRTISEVDDDSSPSRSSSAARRQAALSGLRAILDSLSPEDRQIMLDDLHKQLEYLRRTKCEEEDLEDGEILED